MPIPFECSGCSFKTKVKDEMAGKKIKCPKCGTPGVIRIVTQDAESVDLLKLNLDAFQDVEPEEGRNADGSRIVDPKAKKKKKKKKKTNENELDSSTKGLALVFSLVSAAVIAFLVMNVGPTVMEKINSAGNATNAPPADPQ